MFLNPVCAQVEADIDRVRLIDIRVVFYSRCKLGFEQRFAGGAGRKTWTHSCVLYWSSAAFTLGKTAGVSWSWTRRRGLGTGAPTHIFYVATWSGHIWKTTQALNVIKQHYRHRSSRAHSPSIRRTESGHTARTVWQESCQHLRVGFRVNGGMRFWTSDCSGLVSFVWQLLVFFFKPFCLKTFPPHVWKKIGDHCRIITL